jgi:probable F420-dependent oxidoreductase
MKVRFAVSPGAARFDPDGLTLFAETAETLGFDTIWLSDVPLGPIGDPMVSLTYIAARTSRLKLGANIVPIGRNPMLLARQLAQLDRFSDGRLLLSFVPGLDQPGERRALGFPAGDRGAAVEVIIDLLRRWWPGERVDHHQDGFDFDAVAVEPTPTQEPLEIWLGGAGPRALERVARCADGWLTANVTPDEAGSGRAAIVARASALGRPIDEEHYGISIPFARQAVPEATIAALRARRADAHRSDDLRDIVPVGADELTALVKRHVDVGLTKFVLRPLDGGRPDDLAWLADAVLPLQT